MVASNARVLLVEDDPSHALLMRERLRALGGRIEHAANHADAVRALEHGTFDLVVLDVGLPDGDGFELQRWLAARDASPAVLFVTSDDLAEHAAEAVRAGAAHYVVKRPNYLDRMAEAVVETLEARARADAPSDELVGPGPGMTRIRRLIHESGASDAVVLVSGETGTGKELVARALHRASARAAAPFVAVNCPAIAPTLFESEIFGGVRGAFTGASRDRSGLVGAAQGGTLFLDEVSELPLDMQAKLLRLLENGTFRPVGAEAERRADVRVIASTNRDLRAAAERGTFRTDLYYRLDVLRIELPPLRARREDVPALVEHVLARLGPPVPAVEPSAMAQLMAWDWPGNVRELKHALERARLRHAPGPIRHVELRAAGALDAAAVGAAVVGAGDDAAGLAELLLKHRGRLDPVARELGVSVRTVQRRMKTAQLRLSSFRNGGRPGA